MKEMPQRIPPVAGLACKIPRRLESDGCERICLRFGGDYSSDFDHVLVVPNDGDKVIFVCLCCHLNGAIMMLYPNLSPKYRKSS